MEHIETNLDYDEQCIIMYQYSDLVYYDEEGQRTLDMHTVVQNEDGRVQTTTVLDRELGGNAPPPRRHVYARLPVQRGDARLAM